VGALLERHASRRIGQRSAEENLACAVAQRRRDIEGKQVLEQSTDGAVRYVNDVIWYDSNRLITNDWQSGLHTWVRGSDGKFQTECEQWLGGSQALALSPDRSELRAGGADSPPHTLGGGYHSGMWIFHGLFP
jgi:hypothetical protein